MPLYEYKGTTPAGEPELGTIQASSRMLAMVELRQKGLTIQRLAEAPVGPPPEGQSEHEKVQSSPWYPLRPVPAGALANFYAQLHQLLRAGVTIQDSADALQGRVHPRLREVLHELVPALGAGEGLAENVAKYPQIFPAHVQAMLTVGETAGNLDEVSSALAQQYDDEQRLAQMLLLPKIYYGIVLLFCILIPTLPWIISRGASWYVHQLLTVLGPVILGVIALILLGKVVAAQPAVKSLVDDIIYRLPWLAPLGMRSAHTRVLSGLHILMRAGVDLPAALELVAPAGGLRPMQAELQVAAKQIAERVPVSVALEQCGALSTQAKAALSTAQQSGLYEDALKRLADSAAEERQANIKNIATMGTIGSLLIAGVIAAIAVGIGWLTYFNALFEAGEKLMP